MSCDDLDCDMRWQLHFLCILFLILNLTLVNNVSTLHRLTPRRQCRLDALYYLEIFHILLFVTGKRYKFLM